MFSLLIKIFSYNLFIFLISFLQSSYALNFTMTTNFNQTKLQINLGLQIFLSWSYRYV